MIAALRAARRRAPTSATSWPARRRSATRRSCARCCARWTAGAPLLHVPTPIVSRALRLLERVAGAGAFATWDEAELMEVAMTSVAGRRRRRSSGVEPQRMAAVLGTG